MLWLILLLLVSRAISSSDNESEKNEISEKTVKQIEQMFNSTLNPIFCLRNFESFSKISENIKGIGFKMLMKSLSKKIGKSEEINEIIEKIKEKESKFGENLADYLNTKEENFKMAEEKGETQINTEEMFGLFLYAGICEKILDEIKNISCKKQNGEIKIMKNNLNKMRRDLYRNFEETKIKILEILKKDGEKMGKLKEENDQKFEVQKATHRKTFENVTKNIEDEAEIGQMKRECSLFFQRFEECHRFTEEKIYELATKNGEIRKNLMQINVGGKALQTVGLQIRLTLFDGIERAMEKKEINSLLFGAENDEHFEFISASKFLIETFVEQKQMTAQRTEQFLQLFSTIKHLKLEKVFSILIANEFKFKLSPHRNSIERRIYFAKNKIEKQFEIGSLWEYLSKFEEFGMDRESMRKTEAKANEFANLLMYDQMYKALFGRFFHGQKGQSVVEKFPRNFADNLSPEEYAAYWLIEIGKNLRKHLALIRQELNAIIENNFTILEQILRENMVKKVNQFKNNYKKMRKNARKLATEELKKGGDGTETAKTTKLMKSVEKSEEMEQKVPLKGNKKENVRRLREKYAQELDKVLGMARETNLEMEDKLRKMQWQTEEGQSSETVKSRRDSAEKCQNERRKRNSRK